MDHLDYLESEAMHILREVAAQFRKPALLFSGGKDSTVLIALAQKAFHPFPMPFTVLHIDTGHNFPEALTFRDNLIEKSGLQIVVEKVTDTLTRRGIPDVAGKLPSRNALQSVTLIDAIEEHKFDALIGGGRRDEEKARAKERIFSFRDVSGAWQPYNQRPELWDIFNGFVKQGENVRVFPISNWSELDIWWYIKREKIELPSLYFSHNRTCLKLHGKLIAVSAYISVEPDDEIVTTNVRYRTVGDMTCTAAIESIAKTIDDVIVEIENTNISERGQTRLDDDISDAAMEDRKLKGYF